MRPMKKILISTLIIVMMILLKGALSPAYCQVDNTNSVLTAQEHGAESLPPTSNTSTSAPTPAQSAPASSEADNRAKFLIVSAFASVLAIAVATFGTAIAQGNAVKAAMEAIGRNPESQSKIFPTLILGLAFIESLALYALLISLALLFFNPLLDKLAR